MANHLPWPAPQRAGRKRSLLPEKYEQRPRSLRVRRSLTASRPEASAATLPVSVRGPCPVPKRCPSLTPVMAASATSVSREPQRPSWPLVAHGAGLPHRLSAPLVTHTAASSRTRSPLVTTSSTGPPSPSVSVARPSAPVVAVWPPPVT